MLRYLLSCRAENRGEERIISKYLQKQNNHRIFANGYNLKSYNYARELFFRNSRTPRFDEVRVEVSVYFTKVH